MTARDEARAKCIEAIVAGHSLWCVLDEETKASLRETGASILDSLHGLARVCPIEVTEEMRSYSGNEAVIDAYIAMSAAGDLTNQPEKKT